MPQVKRLEIDRILTKLKIKSNLEWMKELRAIGFSEGGALLVSLFYIRDQI